MRRFLLHTYVASNNVYILVSTESQRVNQKFMRIQKLSNNVYKVNLTDEHVQLNFTDNNTHFILTGVDLTLKVNLECFHSLVSSNVDSWHSSTLY